MIYEYLIYDTACLCDVGGPYELDLRAHNRNVANETFRRQQWVKLGHVCRQTRAEYLPLQQATTKITLCQKQIEQYIKIFYPSKDPVTSQQYRGDIVLHFSRFGRANLDLLSLMNLLRRSPQIEFQSRIAGNTAFFSGFRQLFAKHDSLRAYLTDFEEETSPISSIKLKKPTGYNMIGCTILVTFKLDAHQPWMSSAVLRPAFRKGQRKSTRRSADKVQRDIVDAFINNACLNVLRKNLCFNVE